MRVKRIKNECEERVKKSRCVREKTDGRGKVGDEGRGVRKGKGNSSRVNQRRTKGTFLLLFVSLDSSIFASLPPHLSLTLFYTVSTNQYTIAVRLQRNILMASLYTIPSFCSNLFPKFHQFHTPILSTSIHPSRVPPSLNSCLLSEPLIMHPIEVCVLISSIHPSIFSTCSIVPSGVCVPFSLSYVLNP